MGGCGVRGSQYQYVRHLSDVELHEGMDMEDRDLQESSQGEACASFSVRELAPSLRSSMSI